MHLARPDFHLRWQALGSPQRPCPAVVEKMKPLVTARRGLALQLGVTPEIAHLSRDGLAIDWNPKMIDMAWPGDSSTHRAVVGNWLALPLLSASVDVAFGDGCLSTLSWPGQYRSFLNEMQLAIRPGGRLVLRCFVDRDGGEHIGDVVQDALRGNIQCFGAFKLRFNMAVCFAAGRVDITGAQIHRSFERYFPDRGLLASVTGWSNAEIGSIDAYAEATPVHSYPTRNQIAALLSKGTDYRYVETVDYPLCERCPILIVEYPGA